MTAAADELHGHSGDTSIAPLSAELSTINVQLLNHGWAKRPLDLSSLSTRDHNEVVSVLFELLGSSVNNLNTLDAMAGRHRTLTYEYERIQKSNNALKGANARMETEAAAWKGRCAELEKRLALEEGRTKELREEVGRGRKALDSVRVASAHETKKVQLKLDKALNQLNRYSDNPQQQRSQGLILLNPIPAGRVQPVAATQSPLLEQTLRDLADIRESLQEETEAFRHVVVSAGNGLMEALAASEGREAPPRLMQTSFFTTSPTARHSHTQTSTIQSSSSTSHPFLANTRLQSLIAEVRAKLTEGVPKYVPPGTELGPSPEEVEEQRRLEREREKMRRDLEDRVKDLEVELICAKKREEEAGRVVDEMAKKELEHISAKGEMDEGLRKQRELIEVERRQIAENKNRLEQERRQFETERHAFTEEKRQADVDAVLALLPSSPTELDADADANAVEREQEEEGEVVQPISSPSSSASSPRPRVQRVQRVPGVPSSPGPSTWHSHLPQSPSPLSPAHAQGKPRTPKGKHVAGRRKSIKTPLSRLVLEKAVRQKSRDASTLAAHAPAQVVQAQRQGQGARNGSVLGAERGRKTNLTLPLRSSSSSAAGGRVASPSKKGKERATLGYSTAIATGAPKGRSSSGSTTTNSSRSGSGSGYGSGSSTSTSTSTSKATSALSGPGLRTSRLGAPSTATATTAAGPGVGGAQRRVDLGKAGGVGPRAAAKAKGVWR